MTFTLSPTLRQTPLPAEAVQQADAWPLPSWPRADTDEIDGSLCDLPLSDNLERRAKYVPAV